MFGPDKCGATNKVHLIIKHAQPNGTVAERHLVSPALVEGNGGDKLTHVYTLILRPSNSSFDLLIDGESRKSGSLLDSALFDPPFVPPKEIDDAEDKKPEDWVELEKIPDPEATKPADWDEDAPREIDDEEAVKPEGLARRRARLGPGPRGHAARGLGRGRGRRLGGPLGAQPQVRRWQGPRLRRPGRARPSPTPLSRASGRLPWSTTRSTRAPGSPARSPTRTSTRTPSR